MVSVRRAVAVMVACVVAAACAHTDTAPVRVFVLPHSHNDPGWLRTVDQYHTEYVRYILDNVVRCLTANPNRKFIQVEVAFFERWYKQQPETVKDAVRHLVASGRLEFANGGWTMADEAVNSYEAVVNQLTYGHRYLRDNFNVTPSVAWHIDPFGASATFPTMFKDMGYDAFVINRIHYQLKTAWQETQNLEFVWRGSASRGAAAELFTHVLDSHYSSPYTFDWEYYLPGGINTFDMADANPPLIDASVSFSTPPNIGDRAAEFAGVVAQRAAYFNTSNLLIPFGNDFKYVISDAAFSNLDLLIDYVNNRSAAFGFTMEYATLSDYMAAVGAASAAAPDFPTYDGDFFPYAFAPAGPRFDQPGYGAPYSYWAGFYTSRPQQKRDIRRVNGVLAAAERVVAAAPHGDAAALDQTRRATALNTHHDAVTGTSIPEVVADYQTRLAVGETRANTAMTSALMTLVAKSAATDGDAQPLLSTDPSALAAACVNSTTVPVVLYNPTGHDVVQVVRLPVPCDAVAVTDASTHAAVPAQVDKDVTLHIPALSPDPNADPNEPAPPAPPASLGFWLHVHVSVPATGYTTLMVTGHPAAHATGVAARGVVATGVQPSSLGTVSNGQLSMTFNATTGELAALSSCGVSAAVRQQFAVYESETQWPASDPYIFRPNSSAPDPVPLAVGPHPNVTTIRGPLVTSVALTYPVTATAAAYVQQVLSIVTDPAPTPVTCGPGTAAGAPLSPSWVVSSRSVLAMPRVNMELVTVFNTDLHSAYGTGPVAADDAHGLPVMYTDANGLEMQRRVKDNPHWVPSVPSPYWQQPIAVNYYPSTSAAYIMDGPDSTALRGPAFASTGRRLLALWDRSHGVASMAEGRLEVMLHRRNAVAASALPPLDDRSVLQQQSFITVAPYADGTAALVQRELSEQMARPVVATYGRFSPQAPADPANAWLAAAHPTGTTLLSAALPANVALQSFECATNTGCASRLLRLRHMYGVGEHGSLSQPATVALDKLLPSGLVFTPATLSGLATPGASPVTSVTLHAMETKTFVVTGSL